MPIQAQPHAPTRPAPTGPNGHAGPGRQVEPKAAKRRKHRWGRIVVLIVALALIAWPIGLLVWANGKLQRVDALSTMADTPGTTYLIAGSDARGSGGVNDATAGQRADTIMLLHKPASGPTALISIPRDSYVEIPGHGSSKINAAYAWGGPELLVQTVEQLTGMKVDHFVEVGFGGVTDMVNAVDGVNLCYDQDVADTKSKLTWTAGCHDVDGATALAFSRMRYQDVKGDIGRAERQRQVIEAVAKKAMSPTTLLEPGKQANLLGSFAGAVYVDKDTNIIDLAKMALAFKSATGSGGITGTPPISNTDYRPGGVGSAVQLDPERTPAFFQAISAGTLPAGPVE